MEWFHRSSRPVHATAWKIEQTDCRDQASGQQKRHQCWHQFPLFMIHHITNGKLINNDYNQESAVSILKWSIGLSQFTMVLRPQACQPQRTFGMVTHVFFLVISPNSFTLCNTIFHNWFSHCKWPRTSNDSNDNWQSPNLNSKFVLNLDP